MAPVPGMIGFKANPMVGLPVVPSALNTAVWSATFKIDVADSAPAVVIVIRPLALKLAKFKTWPAKVIVGSPAMPLPSAIDRPAPETAIERPVMAVPDVFT